MSETWLTVEVIHTDARILRISGAAKSEQSGHHHHPKPAATCHYQWVHYRLLLPVATSRRSGYVHSDEHFRTLLKKMSLAHMIPTFEELQVINVARYGGVADYSSSKQDENNPLHGASWDANRTIRGEVLSSLILGTDPNWPRGPKGFEVRGAKIVGPIDLQVANAGSFALVGCYVEDGIYLTDGTVRTVNLRGSHVFRIAADRLRASGNIFLDGGFTAKGRVSFIGAEIAGNLVCSSASLGTGADDALDATNLRVRDALLNEGFHARGAVLFVGAQITGDLDCSGSRFEVARGFAILITRATIGGSVLLSKIQREFLSRGGIHLAWAKIGANLACDGGLFESSGERDTGIAIVGDGAEIAGGVFLRGGFKAIGEVRFVGARVGGDFDCSGAEFVGVNNHPKVTHIHHLKLPHRVSSAGGARGRMPPRRPV